MRAAQSLLAAASDIKLHHSVFALPFALPQAAPTPLRFPDELEPRVVAFAEAWLRKDYRVLNELTLASQRAAIFSGTAAILRPRRRRYR